MSDLMESGGDDEGSESNSSSGGGVSSNVNRSDKSQSYNDNVERTASQPMGVPSSGNKRSLSMSSYGSSYSNHHRNNIEMSPSIDELCDTAASSLSSLSLNGPPGPGANRVIVIGAGISGLRAASVLKRHGVDVVILEARHDRIGGRMFTSRQPGKPPREIGAAWMHETVQNKLVSLISKLGINYYYDDGAPLYYTPWGPASSQFKAKKVCEEWVDYAEWLYTTNPDTPDRPAQEFIREYVRDHELLSKEERRWAPQALREVELWISINSDIASSKHLSYYVQERNLYVTGGYDTIVNYYSKPLLRDGQILLGVEVQDVNTEDDGKVTVSAIQNGQTFRFDADAVIVTVPLGVLKERMISFTPPMPQTFDEALDRYSYGALGKIFFEFDDVFWPKERDQIVFYPSPDDMLNKEHPVLNNAFVINNLYVVAGGLKELCIQTADPLTRELEAMTDEEIYSFFEPLFKVIRTEPYKDLPNLVSLEITQWTKDKYAGFGTYSAAKVGDEPDLFMDFLDQNHDSRIQFAGEHCSMLGNGCVHGAFGSGEIAAKNLLSQFHISYDGDNSVASSP
ncbi:polyamine oxidase [Sugiyamaella lignohabitans]|uniref:Amine oxidase n=1 Tax=Sugiyamaella lignohabitans TaxID=796027 RepID=A0A161HKA4_9ASCO|nr:polyamine oxidase [Sugiyamaella lignohabitans]ANB13367.1 polyamine oxidase [Sugiyamaella lignohabitans]